MKGLVERINGQHSAAAVGGHAGALRCGSSPPQGVLLVAEACGPIDVHTWYLPAKITRKYST